MGTRTTALFVLITLVVAACGGGGEVDSQAVDGVQLFPGSSSVEVTGSRAIDFGDMQINVALEGNWRVLANELFRPHNAGLLAIQDFSERMTNEGLSFVRPTSIVEPSGLGRDPAAGSFRGHISLTEAFDFEQWVSDLPAEVGAGPIESIEFAGMNAVRVDLVPEASHCLVQCSFLFSEMNLGTGNGYFEPLRTNVKNTVLWVELETGSLPVVVVIAGPNEDFHNRAFDVVNSAEVIEVTPE